MCTLRYFECSRMAAQVVSVFFKLLDELGLFALTVVSHDVRLLLVVHLLRTVTLSMAPALFLVHFLASHGFSNSQSGLFLSISSIGNSILFDLLSNLLAPKIPCSNPGTGSHSQQVPGIVFHNRLVIQLRALGMVIAGIIFAFSDNFIVLLLAAIIGDVVPPINDLFLNTTLPVNVEEDMQRHDTNQLLNIRMIYFLHTLGPLFATACGYLFGGWSLYWISDQYSLSEQYAYKAGFGLFALFSLLCLLLSLFLSDNIKNIPYRFAHYPKIQHVAHIPFKTSPPSSQPQPVLAQETSPLVLSVEPAVYSATQISPNASSSANTHLPILYQSYNVKLSTKIYIWYLSLLSSVKILGLSLVTTPWITYYLSDRFQLDMPLLGSVLFAITSLSALAGLFSKPLTLWLGTNLSFVLSHFPSAAALMAFPMPSSFGSCLLFLVVYNFNYFSGHVSQTRLANASLPYGSSFNELDDFKLGNGQDWNDYINSYQYLRSQFSHEEPRASAQNQENPSTHDQQQLNKFQSILLLKTKLALYCQTSICLLSNMAKPFGFLLTGYFAAQNMLWKTFVLAGLLDIVYDILLLTTVESKNLLLTKKARKTNYLA